MNKRGGIISFIGKAILIFLIVYGAISFIIDFLGGFKF